VLQRLLKEPERVEILHLGLRAERRLAAWAHRDVRVAPQASLLHVAVVDAEPHEDRAQMAEEFGRIRCRSKIRLADDLDERHAAPIEVDVALAIRVREPFVHRLPGVLFHVDARDPYSTHLAAGRKFDKAGGGDWELVL